MRQDSVVTHGDGGEVYADGVMIRKPALLVKSSNAIRSQKYSHLPAFRRQQDTQPPTLPLEEAANGPSPCRHLSPRTLIKGQKKKYPLDNFVGEQYKSR